MNLLVTGGAGFIGTNFILHVLKHHPGWRIVNLDALTYAGNPANFDGLAPGQAERCRLVHGDICDAGLLSRLFSENGFDAVVHFAAESHVDRSILGPEAFVSTNVTGTFRLLEAALASWRDRGRPEGFRFLHVSTDEVYGSLGTTGRFTEETPYDPSSPYAATKAASDHLVRAYGRTYDLPFLITNCSNNFGPFQFPEKFIPLMILNIIEQKPLPLYGDGRNVRDWLYVEDHCRALCQLLESGLSGKTYNIGGGNELTNLELIHMLCDIMDQSLKRPADASSRSLIRFVSDRPGHDRRYAMDYSRLNQELGWSPQGSFDDKLRATLFWYLEHPGWVASIQTGDYRRWMELNYGDREL